MDPYQQNQNQRDTGNQFNSRRTNQQPSTSGTPGADHTPEDDPHRDTPVGGTQQGTDRQPQYSGGFTVIPPNESRRNKIKTMAQKEEEELQRWKEANRPPPVNLNPERLGGNTTLAGARERQLVDLRCSKLQKKLKKEELDKRRRQEEEEELQRMKDEQRKKAERLEQRRQQEEQRRREQLRQDHVRSTESFLQRFERTAPRPLASSSSATHTSSRSEAAESQRPSSSVRDVQQEHRRVNSAFLDRLEGRGRGSEEAAEEEEEDVGQQQLPVAHLNPEHSDLDWTLEDTEPEYDWALMKLMNSFPDYSKVFLEDILDQCSGDYQQAHTLLSCTMD